jgi:hypothetical protein
LVDIETFFQEKNAGRIKGEGKLQKKKKLIMIIKKMSIHQQKSYFDLLVLVSELFRRTDNLV